MLNFAKACVLAVLCNKKVVPKAESELSGSAFYCLKLVHFEVIESLILVKQPRQVSAKIKV